MTTEFRECLTCATKPGAPTLCAGCLNNRRAIGELTAKLEGMVDASYAEGLIANQIENAERCIEAEREHTKRARGLALEEAAQWHLTTAEWHRERERRSIGPHALAHHSAALCHELSAGEVRRLAVSDEPKEPKG